MTTSTAKACSGWKRMNALNSLRNTVPMNVCSSGQSQFLMCSKILREENTFVFRRFQSWCFYSSAAVCKNPEKQNKNPVQWNEKTSLLTSHSSSELKELFQPELLSLFSFFVEVPPNRVISGKSATPGSLSLPLTLGRCTINFPIALTRRFPDHSPAEMETYQYNSLRNCQQQC